jgi:hypothetical protein
MGLLLYLSTVLLKVLRFALKPDQGILKVGIFENFAFAVIDKTV